MPEIREVLDRYHLLGCYLRIVVGIKLKIGTDKTYYLLG